MTKNQLLAAVLLDAIQREHERIERSQAEIRKLKQELEDIGWVRDENTRLEWGVDADRKTL
jgi:prefoldin subunit 5